MLLLHIRELQNIDPMATSYPSALKNLPAVAHKPLLTFLSCGKGCCSRVPKCQWSEWHWLDWLAEPFSAFYIFELRQFTHRLTRSVFASAPYNSSAELAEDFVVATTNSRDVWIQWYKSRLKTLKLGKWSCYVALCGIINSDATVVSRCCTTCHAA